MVDRTPLGAILERVKRGEASSEDLTELENFISGVTPEPAYLPLADVTEFLQASVDISASLNAAEVVQTTARHLVNLLAVEACVISQWDSTAKQLSPWLVHSPPDWPIQPEDYQSFYPERAPLIRAALARAQPVQAHMEDIDLPEPEKQRFAVLGFSTTLLLPLIAHNRIIGLIEVLDRRPDLRFMQREISLGLLLVNHAAIAIEKTRLLAEIQQRSAELEAVRRASLSLTASLDLEEVLDNILENALQLVDSAQDAHIFLYEHDRLRFGAALWSDGRKGMPWAAPRENGLTYNVARKGEMILVADMCQDPLFANTPADWHGSIVGIPLKIGARVVGVMTVAHPQPNAFSETQLRAVALLGDQAAVAIENARLHDLVTRQARTDALTGLPNRRALDERLAEEIRNANRFKQPLALIMLDLDGFKAVNDTYGHPVGDRVLQQVADCLHERVRDNDFIARYGGDEFALMLPNTDSATAYALAERLQPRVDPCALQIAEPVRVTLNITYGLAVYPTDGSTASALIAKADQALYQAKADDEAKTHG